jgi:hypothetical protein
MGASRNLLYMHPAALRGARMFFVHVQMDNVYCVTVRVNYDPDIAVMT